MCVFGFIATLTYDTLRFAEFEDFPDTSEPVWILGRKYSVFTGISQVGATVLFVLSLQKAFVLTRVTCCLSHATCVLKAVSVRVFF